MKIQHTQNYNLFKRIAGNRVVSKPHVNRLLEAIKDDPQTTIYNPIIVNDKFEVIDGQHRLEAIRALDLPVYYVRVGDLDLNTVQRINSISKVWTPVDYAKSFRENGVEEYNIYLEFRKEFKLNHNVLLRYLSLDRTTTNNMFKLGKLHVPDVAKSYTLCKQLIELSVFYDRMKLREQGLAMLQLMLSANYNHKQMLAKLEAHAHRIAEQKQTNDYAREFERIYNYHQHKPLRLF